MVAGTPRRLQAPGFVGVISDTHGLLRPEACEALEGASVILHAGDVGGAHVLEGLRALAPVHAVRGNNDRDPFGRTLPPMEWVPLQGAVAYVLHEVDTLDLDPAAAGVAVVVYGHSHRPACELRGGVLFLNPGSAGPRRFRLPVTVARLHLRGRAPTVDDVELVEIAG